MLNFKRPCELPSRHLANTTSSRPARSCSGPFDGGDDALGEAAGEGDREISGAGRDRPAAGGGGLVGGGARGMGRKAWPAGIRQPMARAAHHRITKSSRQPILKNVNAPL